MKTMGFRDLRIVDSEAHLAPAARWVAHGSGDILDGVTTYPTLAAALHDVDFTVATTARSRARFHYYATPQQLLPLLEEKAQWMTHAALVFGREDSGLSNEELALADVLTGVPMVADYPSLKSRPVGDGLLLSISIAYATNGPRRRRGRSSSAAGVTHPH
ncbi:TrmH family RNA methyltransferase [Klebsiella aerogenes]|nr:TrmH family RNA methyltransferase [Klebsiella aerogenes]